MIASTELIIIVLLLRFEQTTKGRKREHYQWNMDIIGVPNTMAEVELVASIVTFLQKVGLTHNDVSSQYHTCEQTITRQFI